MAERPPSHVLLPGAGGAGLTWTRTREALNGHLFPLPDEATVEEMATALAPAMAAVPPPMVLTGASLGAMVALELARSVPVRALVLVAAGFGIVTSRSLLDWVAANPPDLFPKMAKASLARREDAEQIAAVAADFAARGQPVVLRHLTALSRYRPRPLQAPPPTLVIWGEHDRSVPLADHAELALRCRGVLAPVAGAAHKPYYEQPEVTISWIRWAERWAEAAGADPAATDRRR